MPYDEFVDDEDKIRNHEKNRTQTHEGARRDWKQNQ